MVLYSVVWYSSGLVSSMVLVWYSTSKSEAGTVPSYPTEERVMRVGDGLGDEDRGGGNSTTGGGG
jgi:hypothetical protein